MRRGPVFLLIALIIGSVEARAHNAAPVALDVHLVSRNGQRVPIIESNYGLISKDSQGDWRLLCEETESPGAKWFTLDDDGAVTAMGTGTGYARSTDGCDFTDSAGANTPVRWVERVKTGTGADAIFLLLDQQIPGANVLRSLDDGVTFQPEPIPDSLIVTAIRADPARPGRVVATAQSQDKSVVAVLESTDLGVTWTQHPLSIPDGTVRVLGVTTAGLFLRDVATGLNDLYRLTDLNGSPEKVLSLGAQPTFVSEPRLDEIWVSGGAGEVYRSQQGGASGSWVKEPQAGDLLCLRADGDLWYGCVDDFVSNDAVRISRDHGATWVSFLRFDQVVGMVDCPADSSVAQACTPIWPLDAIGMRVPAPAADAGTETNTQPKGCTCGGSSAAAVGVVFLRRRRRSRV